MKFDEFKVEAYTSVDMKLLTCYSNKSHSSYDQPLADLVK